MQLPPHAKGAVWIAVASALRRVGCEDPRPPRTGSRLQLDSQGHPLLGNRYQHLQPVRQASLLRRQSDGDQLIGDAHGTHGHHRRTPFA